MNKTANQWNKSKLFVIVIFMGMFVRAWLIMRSNFPLNDGGLFYTMINNLIENKFILPLYTTYNQNHIPFAYPPLSLYFLAILKYIGFDLLSLMRVLPVVFNILTIPIFYSVCRKILKTETQAFFAALTFAILPPVYEWQIMGGGITRSPALFFSILAWDQSLKFKKTHLYKDIILTIVFSALSGLCHIEIFMVTIILVLITLIFNESFSFCFKYGMVYLIGNFLSVIPYWAIIIQRFGLSPFIAALFSGEFNLGDSVVRLLFGSITGETMFTPIVVISLVGLVIIIQKKEYFLLSYILAIILFDPRSLARSLSLPISFLSGIGFEAFIAFVKNKGNDQAIDSEKKYQNSKWVSIPLIGIILIGYIIIRTAITSSIFLVLPGSSLEFLTSNDQNAMEWIEKNTIRDEKFLVLSPPVNWEKDFRSEWFPALTKRRSINTVQGSEWLDGGEYYLLQEIHEDAGKCYKSNLSCLDNLDAKYDLDYSMIYFSGKLSSEDGNITPYPIEMEFRSSPDFQLVYENETVSVFSLKNSITP